jgi:hypothetical protein
MTIEQLNECISRMREIYDFKDEQTDIDLKIDPRYSDHSKQQVMIRTFDNDYDIAITLETHAI